MHRRQKACRYVRNTRKGLRGLSGQTRKGYNSEEARDDIANSTDRGVPLVQYDQTLIRACSRFEGVRTTSHECNRRLWTKTALEQSSRTSTSKRVEEILKTPPAWHEREDGVICCHHAHDAGGRWSKKNSGKPVTFLEAHHISEAAKQRRIVC